jgi:hypothetical protein
MTEIHLAASEVLRGKKYFKKSCKRIILLDVNISLRYGMRILHFSL